MSKGALVEADATSLFNLARKLEQMDKPIRNSIRRTLTDETKKVVTAVRREVLSIPVKGGGASTAFKPQRYRRIKSGIVGGPKTAQVLGPLPFQAGQNVRQGIARGVRSAIRYGSETRGASIAVIGSSHYLSPEKKVMNKLLNRGSWRHPVFARGNIKSIDEFAGQATKAGGSLVERTSSTEAIFQGKHGRKIGVKSWTWVDQKGHPFWKVTFGYRKPIHDALVKAVEQAIDEELSQLGHS